MNVQIIETGERETLSIIDPKSGCDWIMDMMGNCDELPEYDDELDAYMMRQSEYDWWSNLTYEYEKADHRMHDLRASLTDEEQDVFDALLADMNSSSDLEDVPAMMNSLCDQWEEDHA